ncbi:long-chain-fatty-acid--CoA ligase ACSBG2-like isoform X2 [Pleurodeles waltl]|uniref:long-chain-fatty-acid--CoA ligase ACSBG2-like isoform X2 n=1 Tax=Pleurodeles waltl TaxID=8319 RepID=UPI003709913D
MQRPALVDMTSVDLEEDEDTEVKLAPADSLWTTECDGAVQLRMEEMGDASSPPITTLQMFRETVQKYSDKVAFAKKRDGQWETTTYLQYYNKCRAAAKGFLRLGLEPFHGVGILGFNAPEWLISTIGGIMAGGLAVGIYTSNSPEACQYVAENCKANILVVENPQQLAKILQVQDQLPHLKAIVQYSGELEEERPNLYTWKDFMELGEEVPDSDVDAIIASRKANQCCLLIYTSGTTGQPKGVMLSHDNITWTSKAIGKRMRLNKDVLTVSYLPLSHIAAQMLDIWIAICHGGATYFAQPDALKGSLVSTLQEVQPTLFLGVPRVWEKIQERMKEAESKASFIKLKISTWAKGVGLEAGKNRMNGNTDTPWGFMLADALVFQRVKAALGLDHCTLSLTGAAPITNDTMEFFLSLNIPLMEIYGMSECSGPHTMSQPDAFRIPSCGMELEGCQTRIHRPEEDGTGEICFWGRHVFMGYLNMEDSTKEALDEEGWLHSGDLGKHDEDGFLYVTGRIKELIITAGGENIPLVLIETAVKDELPIISNAMLVGDKRKFLSMLLTLKCKVDLESGEPQDDLTPEAIQLCQQLGSSATRVSEVVRSKDPAINDAINRGMERVNQKATSNAQKVQKWTILEKDFSIVGGELGPTLKLRRPVVLKMYEKLIDEFYTS